MTKPLNIAINGQSIDYALGHHVAWHQHDRHQYIHAIAGVMHVGVKDAVWIVPPGRGLWVPGGVVHSIRCIGIVRLRTVYIAGSGDGIPKQVKVLETSPLLREVIVRLCDSDGDGDGDRGSIDRPLAEIFLFELTGSAAWGYNIPASKDQRVQRIYNTLCENPEDSTGLRQWAAILHLSERSLIRLIQRETGMSFRDYRRQIRIMTSIGPLSAGMPVTTVALDSGFRSISAYIQAFRQVTGKTPGKFL